MAEQADADKLERRLGRKHRHRAPLTHAHPPEADVDFYRLRQWFRDRPQLRFRQ
jgi:hypothetical protein